MGCISAVSPRSRVGVFFSGGSSPDDVKWLESKERVAAEEKALSLVECKEGEPVRGGIPVQYPMLNIRHDISIYLF